MQNELVSARLLRVTERFDKGPAAAGGISAKQPFSCVFRSLIAPKGIQSKGTLRAVGKRRLEGQALIDERDAPKSLPPLIG